MTDTSPNLTIQIDGPVTVSITGDAFIRALTDALPDFLLQALVTRTVEPADFNAELATTAKGTTTAGSATAAAIDTSPSGVQAADTAAAVSGWTVALAKSWFEHDSDTGRSSLRTVITCGGVATPTEMADALDRDITASHTFTGVFSGTAKRFKHFQATQPGAAALPYPIVTVYDDDISGRQTAKAFALLADTLGVFQIALAVIGGAVAAV